MATVSHYIPPLNASLICCKGGPHQEQPLNLVCLDPLCRTSPLSCSVCFTQIHKFHKVVGLSKFIDDYKRNAGSTKTNMLQNKINKHYHSLKQKTQKFKQHFLNQMQKFQKAIDKYAEYLTGQSYVRDCVGQQLKLELQPEKIINIKSQDDLQSSIRFILNNSLYDSNLNMVNISQILKQNQDRVCALLDKMVYMTEFCQKSINEALSLLKFANKTIKQQKIQINKKINKLMDAQPDPTSLKHFLSQKSKLKKIIEQKSCLILQQSQKIDYLQQWNDFQKTSPQYLFGKYRFRELQLANNGICIRSITHSEKPQYALAWPNLNLEPQTTKQWFIKINSCRDFLSQNTMAVGISRLSDMKLSNFKGNPTNCLMVTSQGYVTLNGKTEKTAFQFKSGDVLHFKYDPYYGTLEITRQNGRRLTLRALGSDQPVYACVKFTYASDQVQFV